ncbi:hypothetical protein [Gimesia sp.]|uniref:hypothetical protein n=1 Tax=Gimesia sp. TaxID=2024833 RepID=UPI003A92BDE0
MEFYEEHMERLSLREFLRLCSPRIVLGFYVWLMCKFRLAHTKPGISPVKEDIRERLIELDQVPETSRSEVISILDHFAEQGFVEPLLESYLHGRNRDHLKLIGVRVLSRHKSGRYVVSAPVIFGEANSACWGNDGLHTFIDSERTITTTVGSQRFDKTPGSSVTYHSECKIEELLEHHRQVVAKRGESYQTIHNQDEMLLYLQRLSDRFVNQLVQRGYLVPFEPEEGPELPEMIDYGFKPVKDENVFTIPLWLVFVFVALTVILFKLLK